MHICPSQECRQRYGTLVSFPDPFEARASERGEEGSGENRQALVTAAGNWAAPIRLLVAEYCAISHLANELYIPYGRKFWREFILADC